MDHYIVVEALPIFTPVCIHASVARLHTRHSLRPRRRLPPRAAAIAPSSQSRSSPGPSESTTIASLAIFFLRDESRTHAGLHPHLSILMYELRPRAEKPFFPDRKPPVTPGRDTSVPTGDRVYILLPLRLVHGCPLSTLPSLPGPARRCSPAQLNVPTSPATTFGSLATNVPCSAGIIGPSAWSTSALGGLSSHSNER